jgi:uncharacterized membrane protein
MESGEFIMFILYLVISILLAGLGIPLVLKWVPPNPLYGFRTARTLQDAKVCYPVNRTTGLWLIITGVVTCGVSIGTFTAEAGLPAAPVINLVPVIIGIAAMIVHGSLEGRNAANGREGTNTG